MSITPFADWMAAIQARVENSLAEQLPGAESIPVVLFTKNIMLPLKIRKILHL